MSRHVYGRPIGIGLGSVVVPGSVPSRKIPRINLKAVPCAECKAEVGSGCISSNGKPLPKGHEGRRRIATRKANAERFDLS